MARDRSDLPLSVEEVLGAPSLAPYSPPDFSPDNRRIAYVVSDNERRRRAFDRDELIRAGVAWFGIAADVWITEIESGHHRNLTGRGHSWGPSWSPDGRGLAFLADLSDGPELGPARLWLWDAESDRLRQGGPADVRGTVAGPQWAGRDALVVAVFSEDGGRDGLAASMKGDTPVDEGKAGVTARVFEFDPAIGRGPTTDQINLDVWRQDVAVVDAATGRMRRITSGLRVVHHLVSPDGDKVAYSVLRGADEPGSGRYRYDIVVVGLSSDDEQVVASDILLPLMANTFSWSPAGDAVAWRTGGPSVPDEVFVAPLDGSSTRRLADAPPVDEMTAAVEAPVWDPSGEHIYYTRDRGTLWRAAVDGSGGGPFAASEGYELDVIAPRQGRLFTVDADATAAVLHTHTATKRVGMSLVDLTSGGVSPIYEEDKRYGGYGTEPSISPDGTLVAYVVEDAVHTPDVYVRDGDLSRPRQVSEVAPGLTGRSLGRAEVVEWHGIDGSTHRGALVYPSSYRPGQTYPLILKLYGGSELSRFVHAFGNANAPIENVQLFATRGYAVLLADSDVNVGTPMLDLLKTVMPGINKAVEMGVADPERVGVTGHSYGGYSTLALITQSSRFKAAVVRAGLGDLISSYGQLAPDGTNYGLAWAESGQGRMGGTPWEFRDRYIDNSPLFRLDRVDTPVLIVHGTEDDAVPAFLADQVFTGLRRLGKTVTYLRYQGEDHWEGGWRYENQIDVLNRVLAWFDRHLAR